MNELPLSMQSTEPTSTPTIPEPAHKETPIKPPDSIAPKSKTPLIISLLVVLLLLALGLAGYFYLNPRTTEPASTSASPTPTTSADPTADWETYINDELGISFLYPPEWDVDDGDGRGDMIRILKQPNQPIVMFTFGQARLNKLSYDSGQRVSQPTEMPSINVGSNTYPTQQDIFGEGVPGYKNCMNEYSSIEYFVDVKQSMIATIHAVNELICEEDGTQTKSRQTSKEDIDLAKQILSTFQFTDQASTLPTTPAGSKRYTSPNLGVTFLYQPDQGGESFTVKEVENKIYLYPSQDNLDSGQYVEIYDKNPTDSLTTAIDKAILNNYSLSDCISTSTDYSDTYITARIKLPSSDSGDMEILSQEAQKCPQPYAAYGGLAYFAMDPSHPDKFAFFSIGQYAIMGDQEQAWQDTFQFIN